MQYTFIRNLKLSPELKVYSKNSTFYIGLSNLGKIVNYLQRKFFVKKTIFEENLSIISD